MDPIGAPVAPGDVLAGKYRVERVLGVGGMGVVVAARHLQLGQRVALKFMRREALGSEEAVSRFLREAQAAVRIQSEHVARVSDVGTLESGAPYIVLEYLEGTDLAAVLETQGKLPIQDAVDYVLQACEAIAEAHSLGMVHRDLKPGNLFLSRRKDGSSLVKVLDFGISKVQGATGGEAAGGLTATGAVMGSPAYMSPEQLMSARSVDARTDIWALGVVLHELVAGSPPFVADTIPGLAALITWGSPAPLCAALPDAPPELDAIVARCLEKDKGRRFQDVAELALSLRPFASASASTSIDRIAGILKSEAGPAGASAASRTMTLALPAVGTQNSWGQTIGTKKSGRARRVALAGVALAVMLALAVFALRDPPDGSEAAADPSGVTASAPAFSSVPSAPSSTPPASTARVPAVAPAPELPSPSATPPVRGQPMIHSDATKDEPARTVTPVTKKPPVARPKQPTEDESLGGRL